MLHREDRDGIAILRLAHGKANAIDLELLASLDAMLGSIAVSPARAAILTGSGNIFSAGVDLFRLLAEDATYLERFLSQLDTTLRRLFTLPLPVVAAVNGHAIAGGAILAAACDRRVAADGPFKLGVTELRVGVPFPTTALEILRALLPARALADLVLSARLVSPSEARQLGLVDELVTPEALLGRAAAAAAELAAVPPGCFAATKQALRRPALERIDLTAPFDEPEVRRIWADPVTHGAIRAFLDQAIGKHG